MDSPSLTKPRTPISQAPPAAATTHGTAPPTPSKDPSSSDPSSFHLLPSPAAQPIKLVSGSATAAGITLVKLMFEVIYFLYFLS